MKDGEAVAYIEQKIRSEEGAASWASDLRSQKKRVVFTNGCFDILHRGHVDYLARASDLGDALVVGLNSDSSVRRLGKGTSRPIQDQQSRAILLAAMEFVDTVVIFEEDNPFRIIAQIKPDVLVKGADYDEQELDPGARRYIVGSDIVRAAGGTVRTIKFLEGFSTSVIERKIRESV
ncbi:MAG: D-beta-D-heptose 7-phosphate kinase / D-beta-D-heptose 1-phosphate adenosyltransferase [Verrucomicrobia bacterium]|jgi:rfaE bifunctional protein nucleotidyltransferase chain/domain|nr:MAG: D-beta-D-heptose 7-phosphate kinase / D-beta-D-heptose 1-phosphate adenosyltransferase [Verrucomicrobiota bacterium]